MTDTSSAPEGVDTSAPHSARVWNYWLGGKDNYKVDRDFGDHLLTVYPRVLVDARAGREFLVRSITHLAKDEGVRQFLDIGTGLPTHQNTHEIAQAAAPESRVVYVDNDPMVLAHARALLVSTAEGRTEYVDADLHDTDQVLAKAGEVLDLEQPVALSVIATAGHIPDLEQALGIIRAYMEALPAGSFLVFGDNVMPDDPVAVDALDQWNEGAALTYRSHTLAEFTRYFDGFELLDPGVVQVTRWRPAPVEIGTAQETDMYGAVARKP